MQRYCFRSELLVQSYSSFTVEVVCNCQRFCCYKVNIGIVFKEYIVKLGNAAICRSVIKERGGLVFSFLE